MGAKIDDPRESSRSEEFFCVYGGEGVLELQLYNCVQPEIKFLRNSKHFWKSINPKIFSLSRGHIFSFKKAVKIG